MPIATSSFSADIRLKNGAPPIAATAKPMAQKTHTDYGPNIKIIACLGLVCVQVFAASVLKLAQKNGVYSFSPQSSLVMSETIKTLLSIVYLFIEPSSSSSSSSPSPSSSGTTGGVARGREGTGTGTTIHIDDPFIINPAFSNTNLISTTLAKIAHMRRLINEQSSKLLLLHMFGLAALYCINNAIMFWLFARADPGSISLIKSGATIVSAILLYIWRRFKLSIPRYLVIIVQVLGLVVAQYDACKNQTVLTPIVYLMLFISLLNSSVANVWNEHVIKNFHVAGLAVKNIYLYAFGALLNLIAFGGYRIWYTDTPTFFQGYDGLAALGVVTSNAFIGIAINVVYKYADALVKNIATTTTTVVLLIVSAMFFAGRNDVMVFVGTIVVICGTFLYFLLGLSEAESVELKKKLENYGKISDEIQE